MTWSIPAFFLISLPWLNPFSVGPTPAAVPLLFSWACAAILLLVCTGALGRFPARCLVNATAWAWLAAALLSALLGVLQYFGATAVFGPWVNNTQVGEAFANLRQRNQFATLTNIGLAALLWSAAMYKGRTTWQSAAALVLATGNAASSSRTGLMEMLALLALAWVWGGWRQPYIRRILLVALVAYGVATISLPFLAGLDFNAIGVLARLREGDPACASRLTLWNNVLHLIASKPWFGWGWGELDYAHFTTLYDGPRFCDILDNAHNLPLHIAVELGLPVAALACSLGLWQVWRSKPWRESSPTTQLAWAVLGLILLHSMLEYPLWYGPFQMAAGLCIWMLLREGRAAPPNQPTPEAQLREDRVVLPSPLAKLAAACSALLLMVGVAYAAWDYRRVSQLYLPTTLRSPAYRDNTLEKIQGSWLFRNQVRFAELTTTDVNPANAASLNAMAHHLLHFSPEARVVEKLIESALMLRRDEEALAYLARYQAAFPAEHARWAKANQMPAGVPLPTD